MRSATRRQLFLHAPGVRPQRGDLARNVAASAGHGTMSCRNEHWNRRSNVGGLRKGCTNGDASMRSSFHRNQIQLESSMFTSPPDQRAPQNGVSRRERTSYDAPCADLERLQAYVVNCVACHNGDSRTGHARSRVYSTGFTRYLTPGRNRVRLARHTSRFAHRISHDTTAQFGNARHYRPDATNRRTARSNL